MKKLVGRRKAVKGGASSGAKGGRSGRRTIAGLTGAAVPLDVDDGDDPTSHQVSKPESSGVASGTPRTDRDRKDFGVSKAEREAILAEVARDPSAKPADRLRAVQLLDELDRRDGDNRQARSLFSISREPSLATTAPVN